MGGTVVTYSPNIIPQFIHQYHVFPHVALPVTQPAEREKEKQRERERGLIPTASGVTIVSWNHLQ